jgi:hypothetical protein
LTTYSFGGGARTQRLVERFIATLFVVGFYYSWYRYPFKINASTTSPTYGDTPIALRLGKYLILAGVILWFLSARSVVRQPLRVANPLALLLLTYMMLLPMVIAGNIGQFDMVEQGFVLIPGILLVFFPEVRLPVATFNRQLRLFLYVGFAVNALQVFLFLAFGRLPALAYENSISVRFGSILDDPNSFGLLLSWLFPFSAFYFDGLKRVAILSGLVLCLILTQSLTAFVVFMVVAGTMVSIAAATRIRSLFMTAVAGLATAAVVWAVFLAFGREIMTVLRLYWLGRQGSNAAHAEAIPTLFNLRLINLLGLEPRPKGFFSETAYVNILGQFGIPYFLVFVGLGAWAGWRALTLLRDPRSGRETQAFAAGALGLFAVVYVGSLALPLPAAFPINMMVGTVIGALISLAPPAPEDTAPARMPEERAMVRSSSSA